LLLITAALQEELKVALSQFSDAEKIRHRGVEFWRATQNDRTIHFLKTGVGPKRSAASLERALKVLEASRILVVGYAGALDPDLKLGTLVVVEKAFRCSIEASNPAVENIRMDGEFTLSPDPAFAQAAESARLPVFFGNTLTSAHIWGKPEHKRVLKDKFKAAIVDMETAALANVSESNGIPLRCLRVISDEAGDSFLEPFAYDPAASLPQRAGKVIRKGNPTKLFREWKCNTSLARVSLGRFLAEYLSR
jgi:adenosylhomocysteine nucleosidase